jgi:DNA-binding YbaB/EbfC family protein
MEEIMQQPDLNQLMRNMQKMQQAMERIQNELAVTTVEGTSGGGAVKIACNGALEFTSVKIKPEAVDPNDVETLEDLILTALKDASQKARDLGQEKMGRQLSGIQLPPGLNF